MKKYLLLAVALLGVSAMAAIIPLEDKGFALSPMGSNPMILSASENNTSSNVYSLEKFPQYANLPADTAGYAWLRCADSAGTDSIGGVLIWQGNPRQDGIGADWVNLDSVTITAGTGTAFLQTGKWVIIDKTYMAIRFKLKNQWATAAAKSSCYTYFNRRLRMAR